MGHTLAELQAHVLHLLHRLETEDKEGRDYHHVVSAYSLALSYYRQRLALDRSAV